MAPGDDLAVLLQDERINAALGWALLGLVVVLALESAGDGDWVWGMVAVSVVVIGTLPALAYRNYRVMVPWEVVAVAVLPMITRGITERGSLSEVASYLSVAAVALIIAVELDVFSRVKMTRTFAVVFVVVATLATAGGWAILQWLSDHFLGTTFLYPTPPPVSEEIEVVALEGLMWDFVAAMAAGVLAGLLFAFHFRGSDERIEAGS
ncbi:MAG: hypothetical protein ABEJ44_05390 [Halanaeroarchaeum sp.]